MLQLFAVLCEEGNIIIIITIMCTAVVYTLKATCCHSFLYCIHIYYTISNILQNRQWCFIRDTPTYSYQYKWAIPPHPCLSDLTLYLGICGKYCTIFGGGVILCCWRVFGCTFIRWHCSHTLLENLTDEAILLSSMWRNFRPFDWTLRHIGRRIHIVSSVTYIEIRQNFSNSVGIIIK